MADIAETPAQPNATEPEIEDRLTADGDADENIPLRYSVSSYGADYPVSALVDRIRRGDIFVPEFQRGYVWSIKEASRFIESLLLGLPVPGIFLSREAETNRLLVVDGQQRLRTLQCFYDGRLPSGREFALQGVEKRFAKTYADLDPSDRRNLDDSILHATVFRQDEPSQDDSSVYLIFERLNSGSEKLKPQEVRSAIFHDSKMQELVRDLNQLPEWRQIYGKPDRRMRDQELVLRFLALFFEAENYQEPMAVFLNAAMKKYGHMSLETVGQMRESFQRSLVLVFNSIGPSAFRFVRALNAAFFDAAMVGTARRLQQGPVANQQAFAAAYESLRTDPEFKLACDGRTADKRTLQARLERATQAFAGVE